jgi:hypothetical protein
VGGGGWGAKGWGGCCWLRLSSRATAILLLELDPLAHDGAALWAVQDEKYFLEHQLRDNPHRNIVQLHHVLRSRPYEDLQGAARAAVDPALFRRVDWGAHAVFLVTDFVSYSLEEALAFRLKERKEVFDAGADVQCEEPSWAIAVVSDVAEALLCLWRLRILHLDVSTKNITIAASGTRSRPLPHAVLIDFGCALHVGDTTVSLKGASGSRLHIAPEVLAAAERVRGRDAVDVGVVSSQPVFELGVLAYEVARGGLHPLPGYPHAYRTETGGLEWTDARLPALPVRFPQGFATVVASCVRCDPKRRPLLQDVVTALRHLREAEGLAPAYQLPPRAPWMRADCRSMIEAVRRSAQRHPVVGAAPAASSPSVLLCAAQVRAAMLTLPIDAAVRESVCGVVEEAHGDRMDLGLLVGALRAAGVSAQLALCTVCGARSQLVRPCAGCGPVFAVGSALAPLRVVAAGASCFCAHHWFNNVPCSRAPAGV